MHAGDMIHQVNKYRLTVSISDHSESSDSNYQAYVRSSISEPAVCSSSSPIVSKDENQHPEEPEVITFFYN